MNRRPEKPFTSEPLHSPAAEQNKGPILEVLRRVLPRDGLVLEIASGTGQHVVYFAAALPALTWQPSEPDEDLRRSISARIGAEHLTNVAAPLALDVFDSPWPVDRADAMVCINLVHITPWATTEALLTGAGQVLADDGVLLMYGPYRRFGAHTAPSNEAFDAALRRRDPAWGVRDLEAVARIAEARELTLVEVVDMPANNFSLVFRKGIPADDPA
jgi:SAM-dependent methyltransferase